VSGIALLLSNYPFALSERPFPGLSRGRGDT
jgi:hypothetical protein